MEWSTPKEFMEAFLEADEYFMIVVDDSGQRREVVEILLENGCWHGGSGESLNMYNDPDYATDKWMRIFNTLDGLEYATYHCDGDKETTFDEFMQLFRPVAHTQVDDLL